MWPPHKNYAGTVTDFSHFLLQPLRENDEMSHAGESKESEAGSSAKGGSEDVEDEEALWRDVNNDIGELLKERGDDEED